MRSVQALVLVVGIISTVCADPYQGWQPHTYCNDPELMDQISIEPLASYQRAQIESLEQVQIVGRHGARAPYYRVFCWESKDNNPMNAEWNCTTSSVSSQDIGFKQPNGFGRLYGKTYLHGHNTLSGNCIVGGLLPEGRQQHLKNGQLLQDAYIGEGPFKIFPSTDLSELAPNQIFLRSDDQERTLGSGQALVDGLFLPDGPMSTSVGDMMTWHVADYAGDHVNTNEEICPSLRFMSNQFKSSTDFLSHVKNPSTIELERTLQGHVGKFDWETILECLSIARCNNLPLPHGIDQELFAKAFHEVEIRQGMLLTYNNSLYAKTAMQPLIKEIIDRLDAALAGEPDAPRLAITMGHDSTIMPLMASILRENWSRLWTPYAGIFVMELYKTKAGSHAVRLLFQGHPLQVPECNDTLCDIADFMKAISFARTGRNCNIPLEPSVPAALSSVDGHGWQKYGVASIVIVLSVLCAFLGFRSQRLRHQAHETSEVQSLLP